MASVVKNARGRPRSQDKHEAIMEAAGRLFLSKGFVCTSMDEVACDAGVSKQTVYSHFQNKDRLYGACITTICDAYFPRPTSIAPDAPVAERLTRIGHNFLHLILSDEAMNMYRTLVSHAGDGPRMAHLFYKAGPALVAEELSQVIRTAVERKELKPCDPEQVGGHFASLVKGEVHFQLSLGLPVDIDPERIKAHVASCVQVILAAYGAGSPVASSSTTSGKAE